MNFILAVACHFCLALPAALTQPGDYLLAEPCTLLAPSSSSSSYAASSYALAAAIARIGVNEGTTELSFDR